jgi:hypothetical protein
VAPDGLHSYSSDVKRVLTAVALLFLACALPMTSASAEDSVRCGTRLVSVGDGKDKVRSICGEPSDVSFVGSIGRRAFPNYSPYDYSYFGPAWVELPVEIWTYNFGSTKLLRKMRFVGDELVEIRTHGYGY